MYICLYGNIVCLQWQRFNGQNKRTVPSRSPFNSLNSSLPSIISSLCAILGFYSAISVVSLAILEIKFGQQQQQQRDLHFWMETRSHYTTCCRWPKEPRNANTIHNITYICFTLRSVFCSAVQRCWFKNTHRVSFVYEPSYVLIPLMYDMVYK